ncbi:hypothetical protein ON010_g12349 [Phytophthora cinnamomi]|nr:hypothetical protein ON010_g12349 [Phytophthora cinnamomi]
MSASTLPSGSFLLLFPEDVEGAPNSPATKALARKVPDSDARGERMGTWLSQAVCIKGDDQFCYGQVTGYSDDRLILSTMNGPIETRANAVCNTVYLVVAMVMGCHQFQVDSWMYDQLSSIHEAIMDRLLKPATSNAPQQQLTLVQLVQGILPDVPPPIRPCLQSRSPATQRKSVRPTDKESRLKSNSSTFFDVLEVDDVVEAADEDALLARSILSAPRTNSRPPRAGVNNRLQHSQHHEQREALSTCHPRPASANETNTVQRSEEPTAEIEIRDLIRTHNPHLLPCHLVAHAAKRPTTNEAEMASTTRGKYSFDPFAEQRRVHEMITLKLTQVSPLSSSWNLWCPAVSCGPTLVWLRERMIFSLEVGDSRFSTSLTLTNCSVFDGSDNPSST